MIWLLWTFQPYRGAPALPSPSPSNWLAVHPAIPSRILAGIVGCHSSALPLTTGLVLGLNERDLPPDREAAARRRGEAEAAQAATPSNSRLGHATSVTAATTDAPSGNAALKGAANVMTEAGAPQRLRRLRRHSSASPEVHLPFHGSRNAFVFSLAANGQRPDERW